MNRRHSTTGYFAGALAAAAMLVPAAWSRLAGHAVRPGPLSSPHRQILGHSSGSDRCVLCHDVGPLPINDDVDPHRRDAAITDMTDRCMVCHDRTIDRATARTPHHFTTTELAKRTESSINRLVQDRLVQDRLGQDRPGQDRSGNRGGVSVDRYEQTPISLATSDNVQCEVCHREHHGDDLPLTAMTDTQCQSCHSVAFESFAAGHPPLRDYPRPGGGTITFDHRRHAEQHYPAGTYRSPRQSFDCGSCHPAGPDGNPVATASYEAACGSCHDESMRTAAANGLTLVNLPALSSSDAARLDHWPAAVTGFVDGLDLPIAKWLIDPPNAAAIDVADQRRRWLQQFASEGQSASIDALVAAGLSRGQAGDAIESLSPQLIAAAMRRWNQSPNKNLSFAPAFDAVAGGGDSLLSSMPGDDLAADPLLSQDPLSSTGVDSVETPTTPAHQMHRGGWYTDPDTLAVRYNGHRHADPVLRALITAAWQSDHPAAAEFLNTAAAVACTECHAGDAASPNWTTTPSGSAIARFDHGPHLNIAELSDCQSCHSLHRSGTADRPRDFVAIELNDCVRCHQPGLATDSCTTCHRYHDLGGG